MPIRLTLRFRIISLVALFAILIIAAFTALLINRQLQVITENNQYRARVGTFAAKGAFERTLLSTMRSSDPPDAFQKLIPILREGQLAEEVAVADREGKIVAATMPSLRQELEQQIADIERQITTVQAERTRLEITEDDLHDFIEKVRAVMEHPSKLLLKPGNQTQRESYFGLMFEATPSFKEIVDGTPKLVWPFNADEKSIHDKRGLVHPSGFEPETFRM